MKTAPRLALASSIWLPLRFAIAIAIAIAIAAGAAACGSGQVGSFAATTDAGSDTGTVFGRQTSDAGSSDPPDAAPPVLNTPPADASAPPPPVDAGEVAVVYAHSDSTLYKLDPATDSVAVVGPFDGCTEVLDLALDHASNAYVTTQLGFYSLDLTNAACTHIADGSYPNSMSFVPKGTLDPNAEALVGYLGASYVRIDTATGALTPVGSLSGGYQSSGDIVSVIGGGTFLTVIGTGCADCLVQVDPVSGDLVQNYGSVGHADVFGLAFWGGTAYGFDSAGEVFSIGVAGGAVVTTAIPVPSAPASLSFWGAGSTTSAPPTAADGGGIPIQPPK